MIKDNPLTKGLKHVYQQLTNLKFNGARFIPSSIVALVLILLLSLFVLLWPYGLMAVIESMFRTLMKDARKELRKTDTIIDKMPFVFELGVYFIFWMPFAILCIPFFVFGLVGAIFVGDVREGK